MKEYLIGFDPGGRGRFGWCVVEYRSKLPLRVVCAGVADHAEGAVEAAHDALPNGARVIGVGIDAPLFWVADGCRQVDNDLRQRIRECGARNAAGTVQQVNSLRGACLVQGMLAGVLSRQRTPRVPISESHPKAVLWLLEHDPDVDLGGLNGLLNPPNGWQQNDGEDHRRDAALACLSAWAMVREPHPRGWCDLYPPDEHYYSPIAPPPAYWMPVGGA